jgi:long-chain acyl-CoA synthetase
MRIVAEVANGRTATPTSQLGTDLGLSSIDRLELLTNVEEKLGVDLADTDVTDETTVAQLDERVRSGRTVGNRRRTWPLSRPARSVRSLLQDRVIIPSLRLVAPVTVLGQDIFPTISEPVLFVGNHESNLDGPLVLSALPRQLRDRCAVAALAGFYFPQSAIPLERAAHAALFAAATVAFNVFPVPRETGFRSSLQYVGFLIDHGWNVLIFPEGTRSSPGRMLAFRDGIGLLATELRVPIVPFNIVGSGHVLPRSAFIPRPGPVSLRFGCPFRVGPKPIDVATREIQDVVERLANE